MVELEAKAARRRVAGPERRELIVRAAAGQFAGHGYAGARLEDIAAAAGVTKPIVYRHFESKKRLYLALLERHHDDLPGFFVEARTAGVEGPADQVTAILEIWLDYVRENSHAWLMLFRDTSGDDEIRAYRRHVSRRAREVIAEFVAERNGPALPPAEVEPTAELLTSGLAGLALWWIDHPEVAKPVVLEVAKRFSVAALASFSPPAP